MGQEQRLELRMHEPGDPGDSRRRAGQAHTLIADSGPQTGGESASAVLSHLVWEDLLPTQETNAVLHRLCINEY